MEELLVGAGADLVDNGGLQISHDSTRNIFTSASLLEEGLEGLVIGVAVFHGSVLVDAVLQAVELPASVTELNTSLTNMKRDNFTHFLEFLEALTPAKGFLLFL